MPDIAGGDFERRAREDFERALGGKVVRTEVIHMGRQNTIIYVATEAGAESCVRYRTAVEFWYEDCIKEPFIESLGIVDLPKVLFADDTVRPQLLISEFVVGDLLDDLVVGLDLAADVGRLLAGVHVPARGSASYLDFVAGRTSPEPWSATFAASLLETALGCGYDRAEVDELLTACAGSLKAAEQSLVLVHNDVHFKNLIRRPAASLCLLDWDSAVIAPAEKDFVKLLDWSHHNSRAVEAILDAYQKSTGRVLDYKLVELFRIYAIVRQILFQRTSAKRGVSETVLSQGGFFASDQQQVAKLAEPLAALGLRAWSGR